MYELKIYNQDDRLTVAQILIKNGYTVSQGKITKENSRSVQYTLRVSEDDENLESR